MAMVVVMVFGCALGWYVRGVRVQEQAVAAIKEAGGSVSYDWEWGHYNPDIINPNGRPRAPRWLSDRVGVDYVGSVVSVRLVPNRLSGLKTANDATLAHVGRLRRLESLWLHGTKVTDAGMVHVGKLTGLRDLRIDHTQVGDAGLAHLKGLTRLVMLFLDGSRVTDDGVLALERALPKVQYLREESSLVYKAAPLADKDLAFARSQPVRLASELLIHRAKRMATERDGTELIATLDALCDLEANDKVSLIKLAEARGESLGILEPTFSPGLSPSERQRLLRRCADRGIVALTLAVDQGYDNVCRLEGDWWEVRMLGNLRDHPGYRPLLDRMKSAR